MMTWESRHRRQRYYYRKRRVRGRVVSEYVGAGPAAMLVAEMDRISRRQRKRYGASSSEYGNRIKGSTGSWISPLTWPGRPCCWPAVTLTKANGGVDVSGNLSNEIRQEFGALFERVNKEKPTKKDLIALRSMFAEYPGLLDLTGGLAEQNIAMLLESTRMSDGAYASCSAAKWTRMKMTWDMMLHRCWRRC